MKKITLLLAIIGIIYNIFAGEVFSQDKVVKSFVRGKTVGVDVVKAYGEPAIVINDGIQDKKKWIYRTAGEAKGRDKYIVFDFDKDEVLLNHGTTNAKYVKEVLLEFVKE